MEKSKLLEKLKTCDIGDLELLIEIAEHIIFW